MEADCTHNLVESTPLQATGGATPPSPPSPPPLTWAGGQRRAGKHAPIHRSHGWIWPVAALASATVRHIDCLELERGNVAMCGGLAVLCPPREAWW